MFCEERGCKPRLPGAPEERGCKPRLPGAPEERGCKPRLPGALEERGCKPRLPGARCKPRLPPTGGSFETAPTGGTLKENRAGRIRTYACRFQRPVPYRLATALYESICTPTALVVVVVQKATLF